MGIGGAAVRRPALIALVALAVSLAGCGDGFEPGIQVQNSAVKKTLLFETQMWPVIGLQVVNLPGTTSPCLAVFYPRSMRILDLKSGAMQRDVKLDWGKDVCRPFIARTPDGLSYVILVLGDPVAYAGVGVMDQDGHWKWAVPQRSMAWADAGRDGRPAAYIAGSRGLFRQTDRGCIVWHVDGDYRAVDLIGGDAPGGPAVVAVRGLTVLEFHSHDGVLLREVELPIEAFHLRVCNWPTAGNILAVGGYNIAVVDPDGKTVLLHRLTGAPRGAFDLAWAKLPWPGDGEYLAVLLGHGSIGQSMLCLFGPDGRLAYQELLHMMGGLCAYADPETGKQALLVAGPQGEVFKYSVVREK